MGRKSRQKREKIEIRDGYQVATLYCATDGKWYEKRVDHLVLESFLGPCPEGMVCRHLNGKKDDNNLINLAWGTPQEDYEDRVRN